jgi:asparagine synthase (glutamine-hydrolysing)
LDSELRATPPTRSGAPALREYRNAFVEALSTSLAGRSSIAAYLSGGLDSTYVVATAARLLRGSRQVHAFTHVPHPDAVSTLRPNFDADEGGLVDLLGQRLSGEVVLHRVFNESRRAALDASHDYAVRSWMPVLAAGNQVWIDEIQNRASDLGSEVLLNGEHGNWAFSHEPGYAFRYHWARRDLRSLVRLVPREYAHGATPAQAIRQRFLKPTVGALIGRPPPRIEERILGLPDQRLTRFRPLVVREDVLSYLSVSMGSGYGTRCPDGQVVAGSDPFLAPTVLKAYASIAPAELGLGPWPRGFARRMGEGLVPDEIRLRSRRGAQSADAWFTARLLRDRYEDEVRQLEDTPILGEFIDARAVRATIASWPWGDLRGPDLLDQQLVDCILSVGDFVRTSQSRLAAAGRDHPPSAQRQTEPGS